MVPTVFHQAQALTTLGGRPLAVLTASESPRAPRLGRRPGPARGPVRQPRPPRPSHVHPRRPDRRTQRPAAESARAITDVVTAVRTGTPLATP